MAHAASVRTASMSLGATESAMSSSEVRIIFIRTSCTRSSIAFACGFLMLVGLRFRLYESHKSSKWSLNSLPLSYITYLQRGYRLNQHLLTNLLIIHCKRVQTLLGPRNFFQTRDFFPRHNKQRVSCCHHWPPLRQPLSSISTSAPSSSSSVDDAAEEGYSTTEEKMGGSVG